MKKIKLLTVATLLAVGLTSSVAQAKMLTTGTTGVINTPNARVRSLGHFSVGAQFDEDKRIYGANVALLPAVEVAYSRWDLKQGSDKDLVSAKLRLMPETAVTPAIAIGCEDITNEVDRSGYVALSKELPVLGIQLSGGVGTDKFKKGFIGLEKEFIGLGLAADYDGDDFNYAATVPVGKFLQGQVGSRSKHWFAGVTCTF